MKTLLVLWMTLATMLFMKCSTDDDDDKLPDEEGVITMLAKEQEINFGVYSFKKRETITITWGDGQTEEVVTFEEYKNNGELYGYVWEAKHAYTDYTPHIITIKGNIKELDCHQSQLTTLDASGCKTLTKLDCYDDNDLTTLDVSECTALNELDCHYNNNLITLDVSGCTGLTTLNCFDNNLSTLDVSKNTALNYLDCTNNNLSDSALNQIFNDLPQGGGEIIIKNNPGSETCKKSIAENKGWGGWGE